MVKDIADTSGPRLPWAGKKVRADNVEEELSNLWRMSADNVRTSQNMNVRTSVLNLVICAPDIESARLASVAIRNLSSTHLARAIIIILDTTSSTSTELASWVTLRSFSVISDIMRHSFEQITLIVSGAAAHSIATIIQPMLKPHLPAYLWWLTDPPQHNDVFSDLMSISSRVIVDSNSFLQPEESIVTLHALVQETADNAMSDLNWGRITPWRQLVAQFFDVVEYKPYINGVDAIAIEHATAAPKTAEQNGQASKPANPTRALLLAAWLTSSLGWRISPDESHTQQNAATGTYTWQMQRTATTVLRRTGKLSPPPYGLLTIRPRLQTEMLQGAICMVRLVSSLENKQATFTINREDNDPDHVLTSVTLAGSTRPPRTVSMTAAPEVSQLLHDEMEIMGRDHLYEQTLAEVTTLLGE